MTLSRLQNIKTSSAMLRQQSPAERRRLGVSLAIWNSCGPRLAVSRSRHSICSSGPMVSLPFFTLPQTTEAGLSIRLQAAAHSLAPVYPWQMIREISVKASQRPPTINTHSTLQVRELSRVVRRPLPGPLRLAVLTPQIAGSSIQNTPTTILPWSNGVRRRD